MPGLEKDKGDGRPSSVRPLQRPPRYSSHEQEHLDRMADVIFFESRNPKQWEARPLHEALQFPLQLGTILTQMFLHVKAEEDLTSLAGRIATYPADWAGLPPLDLALCGMYLNDRGKVQCFQCQVEFRDLTGVDVDIWQRHKELAHNCLQMKRYNCHGPRPTPPGKRTRRNSAGDLYDLMVTPAVHDCSSWSP